MSLKKKKKYKIPPQLKNLALNASAGAEIRIQTGFMESGLRFDFWLQVRIVGGRGDRKLLRIISDIPTCLDGRGE